MFKVIGGVVVCGLALYGLVKYLERPVVKVVIQPERPSGSAEAGSDPPAPQGEGGVPTEAMVAEAALG